MSKKVHIFGTALFLGMFSMCGSAAFAQVEDNPNRIPGAIEDNPNRIPGVVEDNPNRIPGAVEDNPNNPNRGNDNLGVSTSDDCPGGGSVGMGGSVDGSTGHFSISAHADDCVHQQELEPGHDHRMNGQVTTTGTATPTSPTTISLDMTTNFDNVTLTSGPNNVTLTCTQHTVGSFHTDDNVLDATSIDVTCHGAGTIQKKRLDDVALDIFPHL